MWLPAFRSIVTDRFLRPIIKWIAFCFCCSTLPEELCKTTQPASSPPPSFPHSSPPILSPVTAGGCCCPWRKRTCDTAWSVPYKVTYLSLPEDLSWQLSNIFHSSFPSFVHHTHLLLNPPPLCSPPLSSLSRSNHLNTTVISETSVVGNQLTFASSLSPRPRTWTWLRRWSAWCWKSSTLACATLYTTTPTWCTRCSTRGSSSSSSGRTRPSRTSCRTWTRSVGLTPSYCSGLRTGLKGAWTLKGSPLFCVN